MKPEANMGPAGEGQQLGKREEEEEEEEEIVPLD